MNDHDKKTPPERPKTWEPPAVTAVGTLADVLKGGGDKLSPTSADPGDVRKPPGQG